MSKEKNIQTKAVLREKIAKSKSIVFTDYNGLDANNINNLRDTMKNADAELLVAKNTLMKLALKDEKIEASELETDLQGPTAVVFSYGDAIKPINAIFDFIKKFELPRVKSAIFEGSYAGPAQVEMISKLPSREQLLAQFVGGLKSPLNRIVGSLSGVQKKFIYALSAIAEKKQ